MEEKVEALAGAEGVRKVRGTSCSDLMVTRRPKCVGEASRVLKSVSSSLEAGRVVG